MLATTVVVEAAAMAFGDSAVVTAAAEGVGAAVAAAVDVAVGASVFAAAVTGVVAADDVWVGAVAVGEFFAAVADPDWPVLAVNVFAEEAELVIAGSSAAAVVDADEDDAGAAVDVSDDVEPAEVSCFFATTAVVVSAAGVVSLIGATVSVVDVVNAVDVGGGVDVAFFTVDATVLDDPTVVPATEVSPLPAGGAAAFLPAPRVDFATGAAWVVVVLGGVPFTVVDG